MAEQSSRDHVASVWVDNAPVVNLNEREARRRGDRKVGTEDLILGLLTDPVLAQALGCDLHTACDTLVLLTVLELKPPDPAAALIAALGVDRATARQRLGVGRAAVSRPSWS